MTGALDTQARATALRLIDKYGKALTFANPETNYDADTGSTSGSVTSYAWNGVISSYENEFPRGDVTKFGTSVILVPALDAVFTPALGWTVTADSIEFRVTRVRTTYSGELIAMWTLETDR